MVMMNKIRNSAEGATVLVSNLIFLDRKGSNFLDRKRTTKLLISLIRLMILYMHPYKNAMH